MKDLGLVAYFLGIKVLREREKKTLILHQTAFTRQLIKRFRLKDANAVSTPMEVGGILQLRD